MKKHLHKKSPKTIQPPIKKSLKKTFSLLIIISMSIILGLAIGSFYGTQIDEVADDIKNITTLSVAMPQTENKEQKTFEEKTKALEIGYVEESQTPLYLEEPIEEKYTKIPFHFEEPNLEEIDKQEEKIEEKQKEKQIVLNPQIKEKSVDEKAVITLSTKPKLAIIIDDVTTQYQINRILNIGYSVNMAFLPPTKGHKHSAKITQNLEHYMVHLPLQASSSKYEEEKTLYINDTIAVIDKRIQYLQTIYPNTRFLNNHTGSKFTSNKAAMDKLFQVLKKYNYTFIDSRTTAKSKAKAAAKKYGVKMFSRDIFLDNKKESGYIQNQLKKAIRIAKRDGMAIAIGHPYKVTFKTLEESKHLLQDLELVYVSEL